MTHWQRNASWMMLTLALSAGCQHEDGQPHADEDLAALATRGLRGDEALAIEEVEHDGLTFRVRTAGPLDGELVILLHGFPENSYEWRAQMPALARAGYRVLAPDLRGYSAEARPTEVERYGLIDFVGDVIALADHAGAGQFHLVGHDVGGLVAWGTAQFVPWRVRSLTALSVPHPGAFAAMLADPDSCQSRASAWYNDVIAPEAAEHLLRDGSLVRNVWSELPADAADEYEQSLGTPEALDGALNLWRANFVDGQPQGALPIPVFVPTLYVWGEDDPYNCREGEPLTRDLVWSSYRFALLSDVGHWIPEQAGERLNGLLLGHLKRHGG